MSDNKVLCFLFLVLFVSLDCIAQDKEFTSRPVRKGEYGLVAYLSGGAGLYVSNAGAPDYLQPKVSNLNKTFNLRIMWHPDHLLKVGLETGYMSFYSYSFKDSIGNDGRVIVNAVPLLLEWSMAITKRLNVFAGSGVYFMTSKLDYLGKAESKKLSIGWMAAASYIHPLSQDTGIGAEIKWLDAAETADGSLSLQIQFVWKFFKW